MPDDELDDLVASFLAEYPEARLFEVMAEFDLSDEEAEAALARLRVKLVSEQRRFPTDV